MFLSHLLKLVGLHEQKVEQVVENCVLREVDAVGWVICGWGMSMALA